MSQDLQYYLRAAAFASIEVISGYSDDRIFRSVVGWISSRVRKFPSQRHTAVLGRGRRRRRAARYLVLLPHPSGQNLLRVPHVCCGLEREGEERQIVRVNGNRREREREGEGGPLVHSLFPGMPLLSSTCLLDQRMK